MGQITIYLDDDIVSKIRSAAKSMNMSQSKWIADLIKEKVANEWPKSVIELAGAWEDLPSVEEIRDAKEKDILREAL